MQQVSQMQDPADRRILTILSGSSEWYTYAGYSYGSVRNPCSLSAEMQRLVMPLLCVTGRCYLKRLPKDPDLPVLTWNDEGSWGLWLTARPDKDPQEYALTGSLRRGEEEMALNVPILISESLVITPDYRVSLFESSGAYSWLGAAKQSSGMSFPAGAADDVLEQILALPGTPNLDLPPELTIDRPQLSPHPKLVIRRPDHGFGNANQRLDAKLEFDYEGLLIDATDECAGIYDRIHRRFITRDRQLEGQAWDKVRMLGVRLIQG
jgi:hypothetical protein